jgi:hypothetical protein
LGSDAIPVDRTEARTLALWVLAAQTLECMPSLISDVFQEGGKPLRWVRGILLQGDGSIRPVFRRIVHKKNGRIRPWAAPLVSPSGAPVPYFPRTSDRSELLAQLHLQPIDYPADKGVDFVQVFSRNETSIFRVDIDGAPRFVEKYGVVGRTRAALDFGTVVAPLAPEGVIRLSDSRLGDAYGVLVYEVLEPVPDKDMAAHAGVVDVVAALNSLRQDAAIFPGDLLDRYHHRNNGNYNIRLDKLVGHLKALQALVAASGKPNSRKAAASLKWFARRLPAIRGKLLSMPMCVSHGDVHADNWMRRGSRICIIDFDEWGFLPLGVDMARILFPLVVDRYGFDAAEELVRRYYAALATDVPLEDVAFSVWAHVAIIEASDIVRRNRPEQAFLVAEVIARFRARFEHAMS